jgi:MtrB/PioB family decaheme-associated outer membrane protein
MMNIDCRDFDRWRLVAAAAATLLASSALSAHEEDTVEALAEPESSLSLGLGYASSDAPRFGLYNGIDDDGAYLLGDVDYVRRLDESGTWFRLDGRNLGLDSREIRFEHERQGDWGYAIDYNQIVRNEPYTVNTTLTGIGSTTQTINIGAPLREVDLDSEREILTFEAQKFLPRNFDIRVKFQNEEKDGDRIFGQGDFGGPPNAFFFLAEPIDTTTQQIDAVLSFTGERLQLSGGYYGSFFDQHKDRIDVVNGTANTPVALPPGNHAHQGYLTGGYSFTPTTRGTFKVAYSSATQDDTFIVPSANGRTNADAGVDTFSLKLGLTARPLPKLSVRSNLRYEDRDDRTPVDIYVTGAGPNSTYDGTNVPHSRKTLRGNLEASYRLAGGYRVTGGVDIEQLERTVPDVRSVVYREDTDEITYRVELQRAMSETVNGRISISRSERDGSDFLTNFLNGGSPGSNLINPLNLADRDRNKLRMMLDWAPTEELSLQLVGHYTDDDYDGANPLGPGDGESWLVSMDGAYAISDEWQATAWYSHEHTEFKSTTCTADGLAPFDCDPPGDSIRESSLDNTTDAVGFGLSGNRCGRLRAQRHGVRRRPGRDRRLLFLRPRRVRTADRKRRDVDPAAAQRPLPAHDG